MSKSQTPDAFAKLSRLTSDAASLQRTLYENLDNGEFRQGFKKAYQEAQAKQKAGEKVHPEITKVVRILVQCPDNIIVKVRKFAATELKDYNTNYAKLATAAGPAGFSG